MTSPLARFPSRLPWALACSLLGAFALTLVTWLYVRADLVTNKRQLLFVGDSLTANVRLAPGERFQDWANATLGADWQAYNFAQSGACVGDFFLQYHKALALGIEPDVVVVGFAPSKLVPRSEGRFRDNGSNLRWLPFDRYGYALFRSLAPPHQNIAVAGKASLLFGFTEAIDEWWYERVTAPDARFKALFGDAKKHRDRIISNAKIENKLWTETVRVTDYAHLAEGKSARDLALLARELRERNIPAVVMLLPQANPGLANKMLSARARDNMSKGREQVRRFCLEQGLSLLDFNEDASFKTFRAAEWDDLYHLKSPAAYQRMTKTLSAWVHTNLGEESRAKHHASLL